MWGLVLDSWSLAPAQLQEVDKTRVSCRLCMASTFHLRNRSEGSAGNDLPKFAG